MATKIQLRRDTSSNWAILNVTLSSGEIGFETDTNKFKIGNGSSAWSALPYFSEAQDLSAYITAASASTTYQTKVANVDNTEIGYLNGVTSDIQTQIDNKLSTSSASTTYLTQSSASTVYLTQTSASTTYNAKPILRETLTGTGTWTPPVNADTNNPFKILVVAVGGGAGGQGNANVNYAVSNAYAYCKSGGVGGMGGSVAVDEIYIDSNSVSYSVGAGGASSTSGGTTSFGYIIAPGGSAVSEQTRTGSLGTGSIGLTTNAKQPQYKGINTSNAGGAGGGGNNTSSGVTAGTGGVGASGFNSLTPQVATSGSGWTNTQGSGFNVSINNLPYESFYTAGGGGGGGGSASGDAGGAGGAGGRSCALFNGTGGAGGAGGATTGSGNVAGSNGTNGTGVGSGGGGSGGSAQGNTVVYTTAPIASLGGSGTAGAIYIYY